jgi:DNA-binding CsgD family transcriptional regulator
MLENSIWRQYHDEMTIREVLAAIYGCDASQIVPDENVIYAELKRSLTKKELRLFVMLEAKRPETEIMETLGFDEEELAKARKKAYHKIRNKVRPHLGGESDKEA